MGERTGEGAGAVGAEVEEVHHVVVAYALGVAFAEDAGLEEFVRSAFSIARGGVFGGGAAALLTTTQHDGVPTNLHAVPALVAIHGVESTDHGSNLGTVGSHGILELLQETSAALGVCVTTVRDGVNEDVFHACFSGDTDETDEVVDVGVYTAVRNQTHEVQARAGCLGKGFGDDGVLGKRAVIDSVGDAAKVLEHHTTGTQVQVTYFGVAHLTIRQTYVLTGSTQHGVRAGGQQFVGEGGVSQYGGVACLFGSLGTLGIAAPAVADNEYYGFVCHNVVLSLLK